MLQHKAKLARVSPPALPLLLWPWLSRALPCGLKQLGTVQCLQDKPGQTPLSSEKQLSRSMVSVSHEHEAEGWFSAGAEKRSVKCIPCTGQAPCFPGLIVSQPKQHMQIEAVIHFVAFRHVMKMRCHPSRAHALSVGSSSLIQCSLIHLFIHFSSSIVLM